MKSLFRFGLAPALVCAALSAGYLGRDFWYDEAYALQNFARLGPLGVFTDYHAPNNHMVFSSLLVLWLRVCAALDLPGWCLRLLPWASSVAAVAFLYLGVQSWRGRRAALWASLLMGTSHLFLSFSCQLRGYSLAALGLSLGLYLVFRLLERRRAIDVALCAGVMILAVGVLPTSFLPLICLSSWASFELARLGALRNEKGRITCEVLLAAPVLGMGWYLLPPKVCRQFLAVYSSRLLPEAPQNPLTDLSYGLLIDALWLVPLMVLGLFLWGFSARPRRVARPWSFGAFLLVNLLPLGLVCLFSMNARHLFPLIPWWYAAFGILVEDGLAWPSARWPELGRNQTAFALLLVILACQREVTFSSDFRQRFEGERTQDVYYQYYQVDFRPSEVVRFLKDAAPPHASMAFTDDGDPFALEFYGHLDGFDCIYRAEDPGSRSLFELGWTRQCGLFLVARSRGSAWDMLGRLASWEMPPDSLREVLDTGYFKVYELRQ
jgi:hypothetical protein